MGAPATSVSTWAPLRIGVFRAMWIAVLVSNVGIWMQTVGAQWLLVHLPHAAILVALVQTADYLPDVLFGLVGGAVADIFDRRRLLIVVQLSMACIGAALTVLTFAGQMPPALLLAFTFGLGCSSVFTNPAYQSLVPQLVPRQQLRSAAALGSISINLARVIGPAVAGIVIARLGVTAVFGLNALTFLFFAVVVAAWRPPAGSVPELPERFISAMRAGGRYVLNAPVVQRILLRSALFLVPASALWALLPLVATQQLGLGAAGYGVLLGGLGGGAIAGALVLPRFRARLSFNVLVAGASAVYAVALVLIVIVPNTVIAVLVLLPAGAAWIAVLSDVNAELQLFLPAWVRGRGLSVYQMVLFGAQAVGAVAWGAIAEPLGVRIAFFVAAAAMLGGLATIRFKPFIETAGMERRAQAYWPEPSLVFEASPESGPVVVKSVYTVAASKEQAFLEAMRRVRLSRLRTGATQWGLFRDGEVPHSFVEMYVVPSWEEHLRQHRFRITGTDHEYEEQASSLSDPPPDVSHLISVDDLP
ncbi:MAG TPA: MFS transporter [Candidatus Sulfotelmatobacter sp.]|nr:MFS transporter [Candidatus Sulfotelmatobacter sp.]